MLREKVITATEFKAKCLNILEELDAGGIVVTKRGRAIARVLPINAGGNRHLIGSMKGKIRITGELMRTWVNWDAESGHTHRRVAIKRRPK